MTFTYTKNNTIVLTHSKYLQPNILKSWYAQIHYKYQVLFFKYSYYYFYDSYSCIVNNPRGYRDWWDFSNHFNTLNQSSMPWIDVTNNELYLDHMNTLDISSTTTTSTSTTMTSKDGNSNEMLTEDTEISFQRTLHDLNSNMKMHTNTNMPYQKKIAISRREDILPDKDRDSSQPTESSSEQEGAKLSVTLYQTMWYHEWFTSNYVGPTYSITDIDGDILYYQGTKCGTNAQHSRREDEEEEEVEEGGAADPCNIFLPPGIYKFRVTGALYSQKRGIQWKFCNSVGGTQTELLFRIVKSSNEQDSPSDVEKEVEDEVEDSIIKKSLTKTISIQTVSKDNSDESSSISNLIHKNGEEGASSGGEEEETMSTDETMFDNDNRYRCIPVSLQDADEVCNRFGQSTVYSSSSSENADTIAKSTVTLEGTLHMFSTMKVPTQSEEGILHNSNINDMDLTILRQALAMEFNEVLDTSNTESTRSQDKIQNIPKRYEVLRDDVQITSWQKKNAADSLKKRLLVNSAYDETLSKIVVSFEVSVMPEVYGTDSTNIQEIKLMTENFKKYLQMSMSSGVFKAKLMSQLQMIDSQASATELKEIQRIDLHQLKAVLKNPMNKDWSIADVTVVLSLLMGMIIGLLVVQHHRRRTSRKKKSTEIISAVVSKKNNSEIFSTNDTYLENMTNIEADSKIISIPKGLHMLNLHTSKCIIGAEYDNEMNSYYNSNSGGLL